MTTVMTADTSFAPTDVMQAEIADVRNRQEVLGRAAEELEAQLAEAEERKIKAEEAFSKARGALKEVKEEVLCRPCDASCRQE